ncbi:MAG: aminotransferase class IV [Halobacteriovoraceae bacterium]|nr:aminotransferase class IV [Halobacteriovoraceae bacterium]
MLCMINNMVFYRKGKETANTNPKAAPDWEGKGHIFTSMRVKSKKAFFLKEHINRLLTGIDLMASKYKIDYCLQEEIYKGIEKIDDFFPDEYRLKIILTPELSMVAKNIEKKYSRHAAVKLLQVPKKEIKNISSYLKLDDYTHSNREIEKAKKKGHNDVLYLNSVNNIMECSTSNIFFAKQNQIFTPKLRTGILAGITRKKLIDCLKRERIIVNCKDISWKELYEADEIWQTNAIKGIRPVKMLAQKNFTKFKRKDSITKKVTDLFNHYCRKNYE